MMKSKDKEYRDLVIELDINNKKQDYVQECEKIISEHLLVAQNEGWYPSIPTDFDYLRNNKYIFSHEKENSLKTFLYSIIPGSLGLLPIVIQDTIYDSAVIPLYRAISNK